jgi:peptidoglycan/xylan/chitin deacetylase (PgdA/CDA1 family)
VNLDVIAAVLLVVVLAWLLLLLWGLVRGYARRGGWWRAGRIAGAAAVALLFVGAASYWLMNSRTVQVLGDHVDRVDTTRKVVAITFDDGPSEIYATQILADLQRYDARATFYVIGAAASEHPVALRSLVTARQEIGNHTFSHGRLVLVSTATAADEVSSADAVIRAAGYRGPISVRPPYGKKLLSLPWELRAHDRITVMWDLEPDSLEGIRDDAQSMTRYVVDNVQPGSIVLLHPWAEGNAATRRALPAILAALQGSGYSFVTVSELLALR